MVNRLPTEGKQRAKDSAMSDLEDQTAAIADRRKFLTACGKFAVITPPAITVLLSTSLNSTAIAHSGGRGARGWGDNDRGERDHEHHHRDRDSD
jgi:hypothetical protein